MSWFDLFQMEELLRVRVQDMNASEFEGRISCEWSGEEDSLTVDQEERAEGKSVEEREKKRGERGRKGRKVREHTLGLKTLKTVSFALDSSMKLNF